MASMPQSEERSSAPRFTDQPDIGQKFALDTGQKFAADTSQKFAEATESAQKATQTATRKASEQTARVAEAAAKAGDRAAWAGAEILQRHTESVQQALQSGAGIVARIAERSAGQFGRAMGISGDEAEKAARKSSDNIDVIMHSGTVLAEVGQRLTGEWMDFARDRIERNIERMEQFMRCRTPQDFAALQSELLREDLQKFLDYSRRIAEQSVRAADEATKRFSETAEQREQRVA